LLPPLPTQKKIVKSAKPLAAETQHLTTLYQRKLAALEELKKSLPHHAFTGQHLMPLKLKNFRKKCQSITTFVQRQLFFPG
jgi:hypothetical protein